MANEENLKKGKATQFRSGEEAARNGSKGGKASGEARRRKRDAKSAAKLVLDLPIKSDVSAEQLKKFGINAEDQTIRVSIMVAMAVKASQGDRGAAQFLMEMANETPNQKLEEKKFKAEHSPKLTTTNEQMVDAWFASIPDDSENIENE